MAEGVGAFLTVVGLAVLMGLLARCSLPARGLLEAWHRHEARDGLSQVSNRAMERAIYDPDWQWHWEARDRQRETVQVMAIEKLRAEIEAANAKARGARLPSKATAQFSVAPSVAESRAVRE
jgi:hypothetical protein